MTRQTQNMVVLFADICNSTKLYNTLGDNDARVIVNICLSTIRNVAERHKGRVVKTIGDAAMCVFGRTDDAVLAASEMQSRLTTQRPEKDDVRIHIGMHYGPILLENNDVFGDTVNAASYLTAVAASEQILTTQATECNLSPELKVNVRPVFKTMLKGSTQESTVYQVVWQKDTTELTDVNLHWQNKIIPGDKSSLLVAHRDLKLRLDQTRPNLMIGRGAECDLVVQEKFASRKHVSIRLLGTNFYLLDSSLNGTFVTLESGAEVHVLRGELLLDGAGKMSLGCSVRDGATEVITFTRDRRSMYRV